MTRLRNILHLLNDLRKSPSAITITVVVTVSYLLFAIWFPIRQFLWFMFTQSDFDESAKFRILFASLKSIETNFTVLSRTFLIISAILTGLVLYALVYHIRNRVKLERLAHASTIGIVASVLGIGCASCGSVILTSLFGIGALSFTAALPLNGLEFSLMGILLLIYSFISIANKYQTPLVCAPKHKKPLL